MLRAIHARRALIGGIRWQLRPHLLLVRCAHCRTDQLLLASSRWGADGHPTSTAPPPNSPQPSHIQPTPAAPPLAPPLRWRASTSTGSIPPSPPTTLGPRLVPPRPVALPRRHTRSPASTLPALLIRSGRRLLRSAPLLWPTLSNVHSRRLCHDPKLRPRALQVDERALAVCVPPTNGIAPIKPARDSLRGLRLSYGTGAREGGWAGRVRGGVRGL